MMKRSNILLIGAALLLPGLMPSCINSMVYNGSGKHMPDLTYGHTEAAAHFTADDGTPLRGWFFNRGAGTPLVVFYGGNAMNVGNFVSIAASDPTRSYLLINYRGYGGSEGEPSEARLVADARSCIAQARALMDSPGPLALVGYSLGSGVAMQVAAGKKTEALVLICPFDNMTEVACNQVPFFPRILPMDSWNSAEYAPHITCPVTIMRAQIDNIVPAESTDRLIRAFPTAPTTKTYPADHNTIFSCPEFTQDILKALPLNRETDVEEA